MADPESAEPGLTVGELRSRVQQGDINETKAMVRLGQVLEMIAREAPQLLERRLDELQPAGADEPMTLP